ncbi:MAG: hypothetical protein GX856_03255 [Gammaproteobacteria bacterium]|jgi:hypothetical protein|nr:hypothetical protein [Gammaproteobacteria bacterium]
MPHFKFYKNLALRVVVEAETAREAYDRMLDMDDNTFEVVECDYEVYTLDGDPIDPEEYD